jgi:hypothetical protein
MTSKPVKAKGDYTAIAARYWQDVLSGKVSACGWVQKACPATSGRSTQRPHPVALRLRFQDSPARVRSIGSKAGGSSGRTVTSLNALQWSWHVANTGRATLVHLTVGAMERPGAAGRCYSATIRAPRYNSTGSSNSEAKAARR